MTDYGTQIVRLAYTYVKDQAKAEDIAQEVFIKCFHHIDEFRGESKLQTWIYRITVNLCKDHLKSWHVRHISFEEKETPLDSVSGATPETVYMSRAEEQQLAQAVLKLPVKYREVVVLYYYESLSIPEITHLSGLQENTVKTRLRRGRQKLKDILERSGL